MEARRALVEAVCLRVHVEHSECPLWCARVRAVAAAHDIFLVLDDVSVLLAVNVFFFFCSLDFVSGSEKDSKRFTGILPLLPLSLTLTADASSMRLHSS